MCRNNEAFVGVCGDIGGEYECDELFEDLVLADIYRYCFLLMITIITTAIHLRIRLLIKICE